MTPAERYRATYRDAYVDPRHPDHDQVRAEYIGLLRQEAEAAGVNWDADVSQGSVEGGSIIPQLVRQAQ